MQRLQQKEQKEKVLNVNLPSLCCFYSRSGVIEKLEALELENQERMEVEESGRSGARQGRSELRRFHREVCVHYMTYTRYGKTLFSNNTWQNRCELSTRPTSVGFGLFIPLPVQHLPSFAPPLSFPFTLALFPPSLPLCPVFVLIVDQRSAVCAVFISSFHSVVGFPW